MKGLTFCVGFPFSEHIYSESGIFSDVSFIPLKRDLFGLVST